ncbi:hypothetical protein EG329_000551 [Mollisiaceae sp. DMI_Dod_QoI]|nr:hypothetical protein EG329_000551 [Helotiales sp. DMI_Dod_QoI]
MGKHEAHKRIHDHTLANEDSVLTEERHNSNWLAEKVISFSKRRGDNLTRRQNAAILRYRTDSIFNLSKADAHRTDEEVLATYKILFDDLFFFGSLFPKCKTFLTYPSGRKKLLHGYTNCDEEFKLKWEFPFLQKHLEAEITVCRSNEKRRRERLRNYLGTLLHEMIHAFLGIWGCRYKGCYNTWQRQGVRGHGHAWQDMAAAVEIAAADRDLLGLELDLGRLKNLAVDIVYEKRGLPLSEELEKWDMRREDVARICNEVEKQSLVTKLFGYR